MNTFNHSLAKNIAASVATKREQNQINSFVEVCSFLAKSPDSLSWQGKNKPSVLSEEGLNKLAAKYFAGYRKIDLPAQPTTIPDEMVSIIMKEFYGYSDTDCKRIKMEHQQAMCAENCVGNLLERYLNSALIKHDWYWCCGDFVKAIDFLSKDKSGAWIALQIKNRNNSENSSSSAIRNNTKIQKWFRSFSKDTKKGRKSLTNWDNLPDSMQGYNLNEQGFKEFIVNYIRNHSSK